MKYFCFSDIHGSYSGMMNAIEKSDYDPQNPQHQLVSLGDNFGRSESGLGSKGIYEYLTSNNFYNKPICLRGNHEEILLDILKKKRLDYIDLRNGEGMTIASFNNIRQELMLFNGEPIEKFVKNVEKQGLRKWIKSLPFYYETENYILFHGWCPTTPTGKICKDLSKISEKRWVEATWAHTEREIESFTEVYPEGYKKNLVFGHWGTYRLRELYPDGKELHDCWEIPEYKLTGIDQTTFYNSQIKLYEFEDNPLK